MAVVCYVLARQSIYLIVGAYVSSKLDSRVGYEQPQSPRLAIIYVKVSQVFGLFSYLKRLLEQPSPILDNLLVTML